APVRARAPARDASGATCRDGRTHAGDRRVQHEARRRVSHRGEDPRGGRGDPEGDAGGRGPHRAGHGSGPGRLAAGHRRDRPAERAAAVGHGHDTDGVSVHGLSPDQEPAHLVAPRHGRDSRMSREALTVLIAKDADGATTLRAPKLGLWSDHPRDGALVSPGSDVGTLTQLNRRYALVVPVGVAGRVAIAGRPQDALPVEFGEALCRIVALTSVATDV